MIFHSLVVSSLLRWSFTVAHSELGFDRIFGQGKINWKISVSASVSEAPCSVASEKLNAKAGLSSSLFLIPSVVYSNTACLPLQRPCDFEDMLLFSHELQESKSMASSKLPVGLRPTKSTEKHSAKISRKESKPLCSSSSPDLGSRHVQQHAAASSRRCSPCFVWSNILKSQAGRC